MTYDIYRYIFIGAAVLCGVMFIVSVLLFIFLKIPKVISDLSGATARRAIKNIREQNAASGDKGYKVSALNQARGKLTDKISPSGNVVQQNHMPMPGINTTKIETQHLAVEEPANQTTVLDSYNETSVLDNTGAGETSVLDSYNGTSVLDNAGAGETSVIPEAMPADATAVINEPAANGPVFLIEYEITFIHTDEVIETEMV